MKMNKIFFLALIICFGPGCARVQTLNMQKQFYSERPNHIIWLQVAGLSEDLLPLIKFGSLDATIKTQFEQVSCVGKAWNYNLFELRPSADKSFHSQMVGSKNVKGDCTDFEHKSVWSYLKELGYKVSILENGADTKETLERGKNCSTNQVFNFKEDRLYRMGPELMGDARFFHFQESPEALDQTLLPGIYYDRSCQKGNCYSGLYNNFKTRWQLLLKNQSKTFFLLRDFKLMAALKKKDIVEAKEILLEIERVLSEVRKNKNIDLLLLVTAAESQALDFPLQGKEWADFEQSGKNLFFKNSTLMSPVFAYGAMAENFCGFYENAEIMQRLLLKPERKIFNWDYINPF